MATTPGERNFIRQQGNYSLGEKTELGELIQRYKERYKQKLKALEGKSSYIIGEKSMFK